MSSSSSNASSSKAPFIFPYDFHPDNIVMTEEELEAYFRECEDSEGFDVVTFPDSALCGAIKPCSLKSGFFPSIKNGAEEAIKDYNLKNETNFEVVEIEKATIGGSCGIGFYITFKVKPIDTSADYPTTTFQAKVMYLVERLIIQLCRIKATNYLDLLQLSNLDY